KSKARIAPRQRIHGIAPIMRAQRAEQQEVAARGRSETAYQLLAGGEPLGIRLQETDGKIHIGDGFGVARRRRHAEFDRHTTMPRPARCSAIETLLNRSPEVQAPPCTSSTAGNGPRPCGR